MSKVILRYVEQTIIKSNLVFKLRFAFHKTKNAENPLFSLMISYYSLYSSLPQVPSIGISLHCRMVPSGLEECYCQFSKILDT